VVLIAIAVLKNAVELKY